MKTLDEIAQAVRAIFPKQETSSGLEADAFRVETTPTEGAPNSLDVMIAQVFPPPAKRWDIRIEKTANGWLSHPITATSSHVAQAVAMRLQRNAVGEFGPPNTSARNADGVFAVAFVTELKPEPVAAPRRAKESPAPEASV